MTTNLRPKHLIIAIMAFLLILIAAYFGASIHNAKANDIIDYLNDMDNIHYYDAEIIPQLNFSAALFSLPITLIILVFELIVLRQIKHRAGKNIAIGTVLAIAIILVISLLTLWHPEDFDFSQWGYLWIAMGAIILVGNILSLFFQSPKEKV